MTTSVVGRWLAPAGKLAAAVLVAGWGLVAAVEAATITTNDFVSVGTFSGNDCAGAHGTPPNCTWNGAPMIAKFDFDKDGAVTAATPGLFGTDILSRFVFDFAIGIFKWTYTPGKNDPGVESFSVKGGNFHTVYEKTGMAWLGIGDYSDDWTPPINARNGKPYGVSHLTFYGSVAPIPLPAAGWLLLGGVAAIAALRRRRGGAA